MEERASKCLVQLKHQECRKIPGLSKTEHMPSHGVTWQPTVLPSPSLLSAVLHARHALRRPRPVVPLSCSLIGNRFL